MIRLTDLAGKGSFTMGGKKFEYGKVYSNPYATAFKPVNEAEESEDHEVSMAQNQLDSIIKSATELKQKMGEKEKQIPAWIQDHITNSENYISQAASNYHEYGDSNEQVNEDLEADILRDMQKSIKNLQYMLTKAKNPKEKENLKANIAATISTINWYKNKSKYESVNEAPAKTKGEKIQRYNDRVKKLRDKITSTKNSEQKMKYQTTLKGILQRLSDIRKDHGIKAPHREGVTEIKFDEIKVLSKEEFQNEAGPCWQGYKQVGMKNKGGKQVPNCVPESVVNEARSVGQIQKDFSKVIAAIASELEKYKSVKGTDKAKQYIANLKKLNAAKEKLESEMDYVVSNIYADAELEEGCGCK
jgi:hypothetical protein